MSLRHILIFAAILPIATAGSAAAQRIVPSALLTIDQNRSTVVERIVGEWGDRLATANAGINSAQLREILSGLRADHLLAASLAGNVEGLRNVVAGALVHTDAAVAPGLMHTKSLGDTGADLPYTPIVPCRILDTRNGTTPPYNAVMMGGSAFPVTANLASFAPQGGSPGSCNLPASFAAIAVTLTVLNPNFDAFLAASSSSNFATLTQSVVMDFSANKGLANTAIVPVDGTVKFYLGLPSQVTTHVIADAVGYFRRPSNYGGTHVITGVNATDSGGFNNTASGNFSSVAGQSNTASGNSSTVAGGFGNIASGANSTVAGGFGNIASGANSNVAGGQLNLASGNSSTVAGGSGNTASGLSSFAAGTGAKALANGSMVFGDSTNGDVTSNAPNQFIVAASGGIIMVTNKNLSTGCFMVAGGGTWSCTSDRNAKRDFAPIAPQTILRKVAALPLSTWRYESEVGGVRHLGPMAQDFRQAFGLGHDERTIALVDAEGVSLAAIQGLHQLTLRQMRQKDQEIAQLKRKLRMIEQKLGM